MHININNFEECDFELFDIVIVQKMLVVAKQV